MTTTAITDGNTVAPSGATFVIPLEPVPASRPRVTRWGTYHAKPYKEWLAAANAALADVDYAAPEGQHLSMVIESVSTKAKTSKLYTPRYDVDNAAKAVLDVLQHAGILSDDRWVVNLATSKRFALRGEPAHTRVKIIECD